MPLAEGIPCVVASRADEIPAGTVIPPSVKPGRCLGCGARILLSPSTRDLIADGTAQPACAACAIEHNRGKVVLPVITEAGFKELGEFRNLNNPERN